jgi:hypothetical protein
MRIVLITLLAALLGFFTPILISFLFLVWFDAYWRRHEVEAHLSAAMPSPTGEAGDVEADELHTCGDCGAELQIVRPGKYQCVNPKCAGAQIPEVFQRWMDGRK